MACLASKAAGALLTMAGLAIAGSASAVAMTDVMTGQKNITKDTSYSFQHILTGHDYTVGWAQLTIVLDDIGDGEDGYTIVVGTAPNRQIFSDPKHADGTLRFVLDSDVLAGLSATGTLGVTVSSKWCNGKNCGNGDFTFIRSTLELNTAPVVAAAVPAPPTAVPEPGTLSLLGLGLAGMAALRSRGLRHRARDNA